jgi:hypothetical protein
MELPQVCLAAGWVSMLGGVVSGGLLGLFFHRDDWLEGYGSFRRRMLRLGHISLFGLGLIDVLFALSLGARSISPLAARIAAAGFLLGMATMPACCFLTAWKRPLRHLFPLPVAAVLTGICSLLAGWLAS